MGAHKCTAYKALVCKEMHCGVFFSSGDEQAANFPMQGILTVCGADALRASMFVPGPVSMQLIMPGLIQRIYEDEQN